MSLQTRPSLITVEEQTLRFYHQTIQECFAATHVVVEKVGLKKLMKHIGDEHWRPVFLLTLDLIEDKTEFFQLYLEQMQAMLKEEDVLAKLMSWVQKESHQQNTEYSPESIRTLQLFFFLVRTLDLDINHIYNRARSNSYNLTNTHAHAQARTRDHTLIQVLIRVCDLVHTIDHSLGRTLIYARTLVSTNYHNRYHPLHRDLARNLGTSYALVRTLIRDLELVHNLTRDRSDALAFALSRALAYDSVIATTTNGIKELSSRVEKGHIVHDVYLTNDDLQLLKKYIQANLFLIECLDNTDLSHSITIRSQMLLPPIN